MSGYSGIELIDIIKRCPKLHLVPVVLLTAEATDDLLREAELELEPDLTVEFLSSYWSSLKVPPIMEVEDKCGCSQCKTKRLING